MVANLKDRIKNGELNLSSCGLKEIPLKEIAGLKHAVSLNLSNNKITSIPKGLGTLTHLVKLDLSKNQIKGLPDAVGNLTNLKQLNLSKNQLTTLPATLGSLKNLKHLDLSNNPLAQKFSELVGPCQNENQCQQAARNVVKAFSSQSDSDKKKKQKDSEQELKKKKADKKTQNGGITSQSNKKDRKAKKSNKGFFSSLIDSILSVFKAVVFLSVVAVCGLFILSWMQSPAYDIIAPKAAAIFHSALTRVLSEEQAGKVEVAIEQAKNSVNNTAITGARFVTAQSQRFYTYVTTDETIQGYVGQAKIKFNQLWSKLGSSGGGEQKS